MISVIIPAYNAARTVRRCIQSVLDQTYTEWEMIIVDDGSKDDTLDICQSYDNSRIRVLHKENGGVSSARNMGLKFAQGDYIAFIDSDDFIEADYLEHLSQGLGYDIVISGFCYENTPESSSFRLKLANRESVGCELSKLINADQLCYPWGRLFKRSIIEQNHIRFNEKMRFAEDNVFNWEYLCHINSLRIDTTQKDYHKSSDEGGAGYNLSFEEMDYVDGQLFMLSQKLESYYGIKLQLQTKQLMHVLFLKDMLSLTATYWFDYYRKYHPCGTKSEGLDFIMGAVYYMSLVGIAKEKQYLDKKLRMRRLDAFLDCPLRLLVYSKIKTRFLIPFIKFHLFSLSGYVIDKLIK